MIRFLRAQDSLDPGDRRPYTRAIDKIEADVKLSLESHSASAAWIGKNSARMFLVHLHEMSR